MPGWLVLLANRATGAVLIGAAVASRVARPLPRGAAWWLAAFPLGTAVLLTAYVFGEDSYRGNGLSRWDAYRSPGGALGPMFVLSVVLLAACATLIVAAVRRADRRLLLGTTLAGCVASLGLVTATIAGFTAN